MAHGDLSVRVPVESQDELGQLAVAFNSMAGNIEQQEQLRRNMVGDVAHELRTPLTNLRGYLEAVRDGLISPDTALVDNLYEETMLLNRLVADLQELAQAEAGQLTLVRTPNVAVRTSSSRRSKSCAHRPTPRASPWRSTSRAACPKSTSTASGSARCCATC